MPTTEEFLETLDDTELAFLIKYKASTYMPASQLKILQEIINRGLDEARLNQLIQETESKKTNTGCPRCNSRKSLKEKTEVFRNYVDLDDAIIGPRTFYNEICAICGFKITDMNNSPPTEIHEFLKRFKK